MSHTPSLPYPPFHARVLHQLSHRVLPLFSLRDCLAACASTLISAHMPSSQVMNDTSLPSDFDPSLVLKELDVAAFAFRDGLLHPTLTSFLATPKCSAVIANIHALGLDCTHGHSVPLADTSRGFLDSLSAVAEKLPQACCLVDMAVGGLPMVYVNL